MCPAPFIVSCHCLWLELWEKLPSRDFLLSPDVSHVARLHWLSHAGAPLLDPSLQCSIVVRGTPFEVSWTSIWVLALTLPSSVSILCLFCPIKWTSYFYFIKYIKCLEQCLAYAKCLINCNNIIILSLMASFFLFVPLLLSPFLFNF